MKFQLRKRSECCRRSLVIWPCRKKNVYKWYKDFKEGRERVDDLERPGRPSTSIDEQHVSQIKELVDKNRRLAIRDLADTIGISRGSLNMYLQFWTFIER